MDPIIEIRELERLGKQAPYSDAFSQLYRSSKWGDRIGELVIAGIKQRQPAAIEDGIFFLEENPRYFRSGYSKASIASKLKGSPLSTDQRDRLRRVILNAAQSDHVGPEFNEYARLAAVIATRAFVDEVLKLKESSEGWRRRRCDRVLSRCQSHRQGP